MAFRAPNDYIRERVLAFGGAGLGKSYDFYTIVARALRSKSTAEFYILDSDESAIRMMVDPAFVDIMLPGGQLHPQIHVIPIHDWTSLMAALEDVRAKVGQHDWVLIDHLHPAWQWAQKNYTDRAYGQDMDDYFIEKRKAQVAAQKKGGYGAFEGVDWNIIKPIFSDLSDAIIRWPSNLYCTAGVKPINSERADKETKLMFGAYGVVPEGNKETAFWFSTVLWKTATQPDTWEMITIKDRSRAKLEGEPIEDFSRDYLIKVAGWKAL